jgi:hypothetical protein
MKKFLILLMLCVAKLLQAQNDIYGDAADGIYTASLTAPPVNIYQAVSNLAVGSPSTIATFTVSNTAGYNAGRRVLLIGMEGNHTGKWLYAKIVSKTSTTITCIAYPVYEGGIIVSQANFAGFTAPLGKLQLITCPQFNIVNAIGTTPISCPAYNSSAGTGGVLSFVTKILSIDDDGINVSGKGYPSGVGGLGSNGGAGGAGGLVGTCTTPPTNGGLTGTIIKNTRCIVGFGGKFGYDAPTPGSATNPSFNGIGVYSQNMSNTTGPIYTFMLGAPGLSSNGGKGGKGGGGGGGGISISNGTAGSSGGNGGNSGNGGNGGGVVMYACQFINKIGTAASVVFTGNNGANGTNGANASGTGGNGGDSGGGGGNGPSGGNGGNGGNGGAGGVELVITTTPNIPIVDAPNWFNINAGSEGFRGIKGTPGAGGLNSLGCTCPTGSGNNDSSGSSTIFCDSSKFANAFSMLYNIKNTVPHGFQYGIGGGQQYAAIYYNDNMQCKVLDDCINTPNIKILLCEDRNNPSNADTVAIIGGANPIDITDAIYNQTTYTIDITGTPKTISTTKNGNIISANLTCVGCFDNVGGVGLFGEDGSDGNPGIPGKRKRIPNDPSGEQNSCFLPLNMVWQQYCDSFAFTALAPCGPPNMVFYSWDFGDGAVAGTQNAAHKYASFATPKQRLVCLTVTCYNPITFESCDSTICQMISIPPYLQGNIVGPDTICSGTAASLTAQPFGGGNTYLWQPGGQITPTINTGILYTNTTYTVTITGPGGCPTTTVTKTIYVKPACTVFITSSKSKICGDTALLTATASAGCTISWPINPRIINAPGTYTVSATNGLCPPAISSITVAPDWCCLVNFCYNLNGRVLTISSATPNSNQYPGSTFIYTWLVNNAIVAGPSNNSNLTYSIPTGLIDFTLCLQVKIITNGDTTCCKMCVPIHMGPTCTSASVFNSDWNYSLTNGNSLNITKGSLFRAPIGTQFSISYGTQPFAPAPISGIVNSLNNFPTGLVTTKAYNTPGTYNVCVKLLLIQNGDTCEDILCRTVVIDTACAVAAGIRINQCFGNNSISFTPLFINNKAIATWTFGDGSKAINKGDSTINKTYSAPGLYTVTLTLVQGKCTSRVSVKVPVGQYTSQPCATTAAKQSSNDNSNYKDEQSADDEVASKILIPEPYQLQTLQGVVYPNPASNNAILAVGSSYNTSAVIQLFTLDGKLAYNTNTYITKGSSDINIPVQQLNNGTYIIKLITGNNINTYKVQVQH